MTEKYIPADVKQLIMDHINSVVQLEILLLLFHSAEKNEKTLIEWTAASVSKELQTDPYSTADLLAELCASGFLQVKNSNDPIYTYEPQMRDLDRATRSLASAYVNHKYSIISLIYSKPIDKVRTFADAFKLKKDDE